MKRVIYWIESQCNRKLNFVRFLKPFNHLNGIFLRLNVGNERFLQGFSHNYLQLV